MIVHQFKVWAQTASPSSRADGASALARAFLYSDLEASERIEALDVLTSFLDDPSPLVRRALAEAFASAADAPTHILLALADDQPSIAAIVLARSPVLRDAELIDCAATAEASAQAAIASRPTLSPLMAMTLAEIAAADALVTLAANRAVELPPRVIARMVERHGDCAELREALLTRPDLPAAVRVDLVAATASALGAFVTSCNWLSDERMKRVTHESKDKAAVVIADTNRHRNDTRELVAHLRRAGQLSVGFALRIVLSGKLELFKAVLVELAGMPMLRVDGLTSQFESAGFAALYRKAGFPLDLLPAFRIALRTLDEGDWSRGPGLSRGMIERVLTACAAINTGDLDKLLVLLRRFEAEAAREQARARPLPDADSPLALSDRAGAEPLLLTDIDAPGYRLPAVHGREHARGESRLLRIDMEALEAQLCAA